MFALTERDKTKRSKNHKLLAVKTALLTASKRLLYGVFTFTRQQIYANLHTMVPGVRQLIHELLVNKRRVQRVGAHLWLVYAHPEH